MNVTVIIRAWGTCAYSEHSERYKKNLLRHADLNSLSLIFLTLHPGCSFILKENFYKAKYSIHGSKALLPVIITLVPFWRRYKATGQLQYFKPLLAAMLEIALVLKMSVKIYSRSLVCFHLLAKFATRG